MVEPFPSVHPEKLALLDAPARRDDQEFVIRFRQGAHGLNQVADVGF
jgi:hypothetical protein